MTYGYSGFGKAIALKYRAVGQPIGGSSGGRSEERRPVLSGKCCRICQRAYNRRMATGQKHPLKLLARSVRSHQIGGRETCPTPFHAVAPSRDILRMFFPPEGRRSS